MVRRGPSQFTSISQSVLKGNATLRCNEAGHSAHTKRLGASAVTLANCVFGSYMLDCFGFDGIPSNGSWGQNAAFCCKEWKYIDNLRFAHPFLKPMEEVQGRGDFGVETGVLVLVEPVQPSPELQKASIRARGSCSATGATVRAASFISFMRHNRYLAGIRTLEHTA